MQQRKIIRTRLASVERVVVKVGTNLLRGREQGLNQPFIESLAVQIAELLDRGIEVILVSSGAVGAGAHELDFQQPPRETEVRQALAAIGQSGLMHHYKIAFGRHGIKVAQVLLTRDSLDDRQRYLNARNTFEVLLDWKVLPIVNENDTIAVDELKFGDNDQLSALVGGKIGADLLVILTDVKGVFDRHPSEPGATRIRYVEVDREPEVSVSRRKENSYSLGGMASKLSAARLASRAGILTFVGPGRSENILLRVLQGDDVGTWFEPAPQRMSARKRWLALGKRPVDACIRVDSGAERALLQRGKSLLPSGVTSVEGDFRAGDLVRVLGPSSSEIALGLVQYASGELALVKGWKTEKISEEFEGRDNLEVIHRDDMVVVTKREEDDE